MGVAWFVVQLVFIFALTTILLNKYGSWRKQHLIVSVSTFVGWYFSFLIILILPLDVAITFYEKCLLDKTRLNDNDGNIHNETRVATVIDATVQSPNFTATMDCEEPKGYVSVNVLLELWRIVYWTTQFLTWIVLPVLQTYSKAGEFDTIGRLKSAFYNNAVYYASYALTFLFLLVYAVSKGVSLNFEHVKVLIVSASNTWGLFLLVLLLGYGLVEVPRQLWQMGSRGYRLKKTYFDIDALSMDKNDAEETVQELYREARDVLNVLKSTRGDAREKAQQIMSRFPHELARHLSATKDSAPNFGNASQIADADAAAIAGDAYLIRLHKRVIDAVQNHHRCQAQWTVLLSRALYLEDVDAAEMTRQLPNEWTRAPHWCASALPRSSSFFPSDIFERVKLPHSARYLWHVTIQRPLFQMLGLLCFGMTLLIVWSECTFFIVKPQLSLAARILHAAAVGYHYKYIQICAVSLLFYLSMCAYYTVFRLRIYRYYHLEPHQMTDESSLIFSAMLLCRLTPPMCLNFLGMIHMDSHITIGAKFGVETQFTHLMGHLDVIPLVAKGINIYLPILTLLLCLGTWFKVGTRLIHSLGIDQFIGDDQSEMITNGKALVTLERNRINRERGKDVRNRAWNNRARANTAESTKNASKANFDRVEYNDREPIIAHQDNAGLLADECENAPTSLLHYAKSASLLERPPSSTAPSISDLEFGCAFGGAGSQPDANSMLFKTSSPLTHNSASPLLTERYSKDDTHPTPSSIFDDL